MEITKQDYQRFLGDLLNGNKSDCAEYIEKLLKEGIDLKTLYLNLFQASLYDVGNLWERHKISVAAEHMVTAIIEYLMTLAYSALFSGPSKSNKIIISCTGNELHHVGGRMVADLCELNGWNAIFTGANTPSVALADMVKQQNPRCIGLSLSVYFNLNYLIQTLHDLKSQFPDLPVFVGGQAFRHGGTEAVNEINGVQYIDSIDKLQTSLIEFS